MGKGTTDHIAGGGKMITEIKTDLEERMASHIDSRCATADEVRIAWLVCEYDRLTAQLTSAKEEIERLKYWEQFVCERCHGVGEITVTSGQTPENFSQDNIPCPDCVGPIIERAEAAESALASERKETERLREALRQVGALHCADEQECPCCASARELAALQSRQGEE